MNEKIEASELAALLSLAFPGNKISDMAAAELRRLHEVNTDLLDALKLAVRQNDHDMVMTGEELRIARAAIAKATQGEPK